MSQDISDDDNNSISKYPGNDGIFSKQYPGIRPDGKSFFLGQSEDKLFKSGIQVPIVCD